MFPARVFNSRFTVGQELLPVNTRFTVGHTSVTGPPIPLFLVFLEILPPTNIPETLITEC